MARIKIALRAIQCLSAETVVVGESEERGAARNNWETKLKTSVRSGMVWLLRTYAFLSRLAGPTENGTRLTDWLADRLHYTSVRLYDRYVLALL